MEELANNWMQATYGKLTLQELEHINCDGAPILDAFPSTGVVSVLAGNLRINAGEILTWSYLRNATC